MRQLCILLFVISTGAGCQCIHLTEVYQDQIDHVADHKCRLDPLYNPTWDVSRIGQPDWCKSPINRLWCGKNCRANRQAPPVAYPNAIYPGMQVGRPGNQTTVPTIPPAPTDISPPRTLDQQTPIPSLDSIQQAPLLRDPPQLEATPGSESPIPENLPVPPPPAKPMTSAFPGTRPQVQPAVHEEPQPGESVPVRDLSPLWSAARKRAESGAQPSSSGANERAGTAFKTEKAPRAFPESDQWKARRVEDFSSDAR